MLQASVTYDNTTYSNSTIENVSAPLSGKYGQVNMIISLQKSRESHQKLGGTAKTSSIFSHSFAQLVSVLSFQKIQNWPLVEFNFNLSKCPKILLPIPLFAHKVSQTLDHNNKMTQLFRYFCGYSRNCWNYFGSTRYFGLGTYIKTRFLYSNDLLRDHYF